MALVNIVYHHSGDPKAPEGKDIRRKSVKEMDEYMNRLVVEMKFAGVSTKYESVEQEGPNDIVINGRRVEDILDGLEIRRPEVNDENSVRSQVIVVTERSPDEWNTGIIEDISDILMKNALSKAYADADKLRIKELRNSSD
ncbi:MAG: hypothetical protein LKJ94_01625 [Candidatus Methanomethylophilus sp.]|jgi:hypothetical protein|nr:hypothetical protein [Methanomethylophilus sp.]MCI2074397.1 hypothetical protein [Methanomethylophilus sp.]MCI2092806.1 hypothetical protein [Methanomethylophilus sp.]TQS78793.1 MAG: hypothetical protein A3Q59_00255 [Methanomethylophilus alvi]